MPRVDHGDRVQIRCASRREDGTTLESSSDRDTPYWIRAGGTHQAAANTAVLGMGVGDHKTIVLETRAERSITIDIDVIEIRKAKTAV